MSHCRFCKQPHCFSFLDLGSAPHSNAYLREEELCQEERCYPLALSVCTNCWLVQTQHDIAAQSLFTAEYAYFSSTSSSWLNHAKQYVEMITSRLHLDATSFVTEIASNDGYLLKNFVDRQIPCLGIEPTRSTAQSALEKGVATKMSFFTQELAYELVANHQGADLIIGNNVFAHLPDLNDFTSAMALCLKPGGTITLEFPHLLSLLEQVQFDTVYHEHYSYFSARTVQRILSSHGLKIIDIEELTTHGGSLRVFAAHHTDPREARPSVEHLLELEEKSGLQDQKVYREFQAKCDAIKSDFLSFLQQQHTLGKKVGAYGAAAKGNTILNYAGVDSKLLPFVCDAAPSKQEKYMPGSHIPIYSPEYLREQKPDYVVILPWNLSEEITQQHSYIRNWGGKFVTFIPQRSIL